MKKVVSVVDAYGVKASKVARSASYPETEDGRSPNWSIEDGRKLCANYSNRKEDKQKWTYYAGEPWEVK